LRSHFSSEWDNFSAERGRLTLEVAAIAQALLPSRLYFSSSAIISSEAGKIRVRYASKLVEELLGVDINIQKEEFSYAYLYAVISAAGYSFQKSSRPTDVGGIDIIISGIETEYSLYPPRLEIQVKSTSTDVVSEEFIRYPLKLKNYNELRKLKTLTPRLLIVVLIPDNSDN
jgi:hypothetical protein